MQKFVFYILLLLISSNSFARKTTVTAASAINNGSWSAGDTIVMKSGTWTNQAISLKANGTVLQPVVLIAESPGNVILNGSSRLSLSGSYIIVSGLYFKNGTLSGASVFGCRIQNIDFGIRTPLHSGKLSHNELQSNQ